MGCKNVNKRLHINDSLKRVLVAALEKPKYYYQPQRPKIL